MKLLVRILVVVWLLVSAHASTRPASSADRPTPQQVAEELRQQAGGEIDITWDNETGVPDFISGAAPASVTASSNDRSPEGLSRAFFSRYAGLYNMRDQAAELSLERVDP